MDEKTLGMIMAAARTIVGIYGVWIDTYGEGLMRQALVDGRCVQVTVASRKYKICPLAVVDNDAEDQVWFVRDGLEDKKMRQWYLTELRKLTNL